MLDVVLIVLPVFGLIALGAVAVRARLLAAPVGDALGSFTFNLALPALLFRTLTTATLPAAPPWGYWATYFTAVALLWAFSQVLARRAFGVDPREAVVAGLGAAQANTVMIGIPVILNAYGPQAAVPIALLLGVNLPLTMTIAALLFETSGGERKDARAFLRNLARSLATHPILLAIVSGMAFNVAGARLPGVVDTFLGMLAATAVPCALVGLGMSLVRYGLGGRVGLVVTVTALKLLVMPAVVYALGRFVVGLEPMFLGAAVIFAAASVGVNVYLVAQRYDTGIALASGAIALSTALAVVTTTFWLVVLGLG